MENQELQQEYEIGYLLKTEADREVVNRLLSQHEAVVTKEGPLRLTTLSYEIEKLNQAVFGWTRFTAQRSNIPALEHDVKMSPQIVRSLLVVAEPIQEESSVASSGEGVSKKSESEVVVDASQSVGSAQLSNEDIEKKIEEILK